MCFGCKSVEVPLLLYPDPNLIALRAQKMKNFKKLLLLLLVLAGIFGIYFLNNQKTQNLPSPTPSATETLNTTFSIKNGDSQSIDISSFIGKTVLEATQNFAEVEKTGSGENAYITSINGVSADPKKREFWELVLNGKPAETGAGSIIIKRGDQIEWRINNY